MMLLKNPKTIRLGILASGDFACNLYWQSVSLFLLFFYTDILHLPPYVAGLLYMGGALWDGVADLLVGIVVQHRALAYRRVVAWGSAPLGLAFAFVYSCHGPATAVFFAQIVFRTCYALVNIPYVAWSARVSDDSRERTILAGLRMLFGTAAAVFVSLATPTIARIVTGEANSQAGYLMAASAFAAIGIPLLIVVARMAPESRASKATVRAESLVACTRVLATNRAFVTLNLAAMASTVAGAMLNQSVLYYFAHVVRDPSAGPHMLALMGIAGGVAIPLWTAAGARTGARAAWFVATAGGILAVGLFAGAGGKGAMPFLLAMQVALTGLHLAFWAMLPDTVEYGERDGGLRVEAMAFGVAALLQKVALALAAAMLGLFYDRAGYTGAMGDGCAAIAEIRWLMIAGPASGLALSATVMLANPLKRGVHAGIVAGLRRERGTPT